MNVCRIVVDRRGVCDACVVTQPFPGFAEATCFRQLATFVLPGDYQEDTVGSITYDGTKVHFDDRTLTHLQIVIVQKLNRQESFLLSWKDSKNVGDGRTAIWLSPGTPLLFKFSGSRVPAVDRE